MVKQFVLGIGCGRCGLSLLASLLARQKGTQVSYQQPPLLPWVDRSAGAAIHARMARLTNGRDAPIVGDVATSYLPYLKELLEQYSNLRVVCLQRPREEVIASFERWLDENSPLRIDHWSQKPGAGWHQDPYWTRLFPQYDLTDRREGLGRYWDEYYSTADELRIRHPDKVRIFDASTAVTSEHGIREILDFAGIPRAAQLAQPIPHRKTSRRPDAPRPGRDPVDHTGKSPVAANSTCAVLVPYARYIEPRCEEGLRELENRGYAVRRVPDFTAIDLARNRLATEAILSGFLETMWIDSDVEFDPDAVDRLRSHQLPIVGGVYPQKNKRVLACQLLPGTRRMGMGQSGGLGEILYLGMGFVLVRREVYTTMQQQLSLPICNELFGKPLIPFFQPCINAVDEGATYLAEDYAFCHRARDCGFKIIVDTSIRLWHLGNYRFTWEDVQAWPERAQGMTLHFQDQCDPLRITRLPPPT